MSSAKPRTLKRGNSVDLPWSFSPDGKRLAYHGLNPLTHFDLFTLRLEAHNGEIRAGEPETFLATKALETYRTFSPDGRWMAYASSQSETTEVHVRAFPDNGSEVQVSKGGGRVPHWAPKGGELMYGTDDQHVMAASYRVRDRVFQSDPPRLWTRRVWPIPVYCRISTSLPTAASSPCCRPPTRRSSSRQTT
jgi:Tol biopolymer transport system component